MIQVPVTNQPNQSLTVSIPRSDGTNVRLDLYIYWNEYAQVWQMDITDSSTGLPLVAGIAMITSTGAYQDLLSQYAYLNIGSAYVVPYSTASNDYPSITDWDANFVLLWSA